MKIPILERRKKEHKQTKTNLEQKKTTTHNKQTLSDYSQCTGKTERKMKRNHSSV